MPAETSPLLCNAGVASLTTLSSRPGSEFCEAMDGGSTVYLLRQRRLYTCEFIQSRKVFLDCFERRDDATFLLAPLALDCS